MRHAEFWQRSLDLPVQGNCPALSLSSLHPVGESPLLGITHVAGEIMNRFHQSMKATYLSVKKIFSA